MTRFRLKRPKLTLFWFLPFVAALGHDIFISTQGTEFSFSEVGYIIQRYTPWHDAIIHASGNELWRSFLKIVFNAKTLIVTFLIGLVPALWLNRPQRGDEKKVRKPPRR